MANYYLGGYYLILQKTIEYWHNELKIINTASKCFNEHLFDIWSYSWARNDNSRLERIKEDGLIDDATVAAIKNWTDQVSATDKIGWPNVFADLETVTEYRNNFFPHLPDVKIMGIYFEESELDTVQSILTPKEGFGESGLYSNVKKRMPEIKNSNQILLGYDLIGIEEGGDFHTFYCHGILEDLVSRFDLSLNKYGLFNDTDRWEQVTKYLNGGNAMVEPVPWFVSKTVLETFPVK